MVDEAQQVSLGCDSTSDGHVALKQAFDLPLPWFHILFFTVLTTPVLCGKNINNLHEVSF